MKTLTYTETTSPNGFPSIKGNWGYAVFKDNMIYIPVITAESQMNAIINYLVQHFDSRSIRFISILNPKSFKKHLNNIIAEGHIYVPEIDEHVPYIDITWNIIKPQKYYYKVCTQRYNSFQSFNPYHSLTYKLNTWTKRLKNHGYLCVFDSMDHAIKFILQHSAPNIEHIFKCIIDKPVQKPRCKPFNLDIKSPLFTDITTSGITISQLPKGTVLCNQVKLLEEIPYTEEL